MFKQFLFLWMILPAIYNAEAQEIYKNGNVSSGTFTNTGIAAPEGYNWSEAQNDITNNNVTNSALGFSAYNSDALGFEFSLADDFTIPAGESWHLTQFAVFVYEPTDSSSSFIKELRMRIWNGKPDSSTASVVYGDLVTNRLLDIIDSFTYRISNTLFYESAINTKRKVWKVIGAIDTTLSAGTYWVEWQIKTTDDLPVFCVPATVKNERGSPGWNAIAHNVITNLWTKVFDLGGIDSASASNIPQDFPFEIVYEKTSPPAIISFTASAEKHAIALRWSAYSNPQIKYFEIERSTDEVNFTRLNSVNAIISSTGIQDYKYVDSLIQFNKIYFYRLKQINENGSFFYSDTDSAIVLNTKNKTWISYTDFSNILTLHFIRNEPEKTSLQIFNAAGELILTQTNQQINEGSTSIDIPVATLASGIYFARIVNVNNNTSDTFKFQKLH